MKNFILLLGIMLFAGMASGQALKVAADGNVGINMSNPTERLEINDGNLLLSNAFSLLARRNDGTSQEIYGIDAGNNVVMNRGSIVAGQASNLIIGVGDNAGIFYSGPGNTPLLNIFEATQHVGIGTLSATHALTLGFGDAAKPGGGVWAATSDERSKKNVQKFDDGLEEVLKINPVSFQYNGKYGTRDDGNRFVGIIAQEMQEIAPYTVKQVEFKNNSLETTTKGFQFNEKNNGEEFLTFDGTALTYMLINAVQEQQAMIKNLQDQIAELQSIGNVDQTFDNVELAGVAQNILGQNSPNPYNEGTVISYTVADYASSAKMNFYSLTGQLIKSVSLQNGAGKLNVSADELPSGTYTYSLEVDGALISNKKMVKMR